MDRATSVIAALQAGKLPSTEQLSIAIDNLLKSDLLQVESVAGSPQLTKHGKQLAGDVREILSAYKALGEVSNSDNILQETIWHFSQADLSNSSIGSTGEAPSADAKRIGRSLLKVLEIVWSNATFEGTNLFADFASFSRLTLADAAELVESGAGSVKNALRQMEGEVQEGQRTAIGIKRPAEGEHEDSDARAKFERTMDTIKAAGSKAIGAGQQATEKAEATAQSTSDRLQDAYYKVVDRAQTDKEYRDAIETVLDLAQKWLNKTLDTAADVNQNTDIHSFVDDPTEEKHLHKAFSGLRILAERGSGDKSLDDFFAAIRTVAADVKSDPDTRAWFDKFFEHARKSLEEPGYSRSPESQNQGEWLRIRWNELRDADSDVGRKWKADLDVLQKEIDEFQARVRDTPTIERVKRAHAKFASDLGEATGVAAGGIQSAITQSLWVYQDLVNVYLPRVLGYTKGFPIPRTEYKDASTEFVLEDLDISTLAITPGHLYIRNITDVDITANAAGETDTSIGAMTHIHAKGVQLALREVSFYYHDKTATVGPSEVTGILELTMPPEGLEFDMKVRLLPNTENGIAERERIKGFHKIENVEVQVSDNVKLDIKQSNHGILLTLFKPAMLAGFRRALATTLSEQLRTALEFADGVAFDISKRSVVFEDMGLTRGPALAGAIWSEVGHFMRSGSSSRAGLSQGWQLTGTGIVKRGEESTIAMGAEPQVLSGDKHGPKGRLAEPLSDKAQRVADQAGVDVNMADATQTAQSVAEQAADVVQQGVQQVRGYKQALQAKKEVEEKRPGWRSEAFTAAAAV